MTHLPERTICGKCGKRCADNIPRAFRVEEECKCLRLTREQLCGPVIDALNLMMSLRDQLPYRGRGALLLNAAMWRLDERMWEEAETLFPGSTAKYLAARKQ